MLHATAPKRFVDTPDIKPVPPKTILEFRAGNQKAALGIAAKKLKIKPGEFSTKYKLERSKKKRGYWTVRKLTAVEQLYAGSDKKDEAQIEFRPGTNVPKTFHSISQEAIQDFRENSKGAFNHCHTKELKRDPKLSGRLEVDVTITPNAKSITVQFPTDTVGNKNIRRCVMRAVKRWKWPKQSTTAKFVFPLIFTKTS